MAERSCSGLGARLPPRATLGERFLVLGVGNPRGEHARQIIDGEVCGDRALREHLRRREHDAVPALARIAAHLAQLECGRGDERDEGVRPRVDRVDTEDREVVGLPPVPTVNQIRLY